MCDRVCCFILLLLFIVVIAFSVRVIIVQTFACRNSFHAFQFTRKQTVINSGVITVCCLLLHLFLCTCRGCVCVCMYFFSCPFRVCLFVCDAFTMIYCLRSSSFFLLLLSLDIYCSQFQYYFRCPFNIITSKKELKTNIVRHFKYSYILCIAVIHYRS